MRRRITAVSLVVLIVIAVQRRVDAWSLEVHQYIIGRAIELLPAPLRPFFDRHRAYVVEHTIDPDLWRNAGFDEESPRHFLDMDAYGPPPFTLLPAEYDRAVEKYGIDFVDRNGLLPWRTSEMYGHLRRAFENVSRGAYGVSDIKSFSAWTAHYVGDAHQPLHAVVNYDGQKTGQEGVHARFEAELFARFKNRITITPRPVTPISDIRVFMFDALRNTFDMAAPVLSADANAVKGRTEYDDAYYAAFFAAAKPTLERQISLSVTAVASVITAAWEQAGRPVVPLEQPRTVQKVKTPQ
jgi:hypothetical protein